MALEHEKITEQIIGAAFEVHKILGYGFLEKVYQKAMQVQLHNHGIQAEKVEFKRIANSKQSAAEIKREAGAEDALQNKISRGTNADNRLLTSE